jgi:hypothetical protein
LKNKIVVLLSLLALGCGQPAEKPVSDTAAVKDTAKKNLPAADNGKDSTIFSDVHLTDTTFIDGNHVTFLRPDDARYDSYLHNPKSGIKTADAHFGDATTMAIDTILGNKKFKGIKAIVSSHRYIVITDCKTCPITIDRDTINYGIILSAKGKEIKFEQDIYPGQHYIGMVRDYFSVKK